VTCLNTAAREAVEEFIYQASFKWKLENEVTKGEVPIREEDMYHIGRVAGIFQQVMIGYHNTGSVKYTGSHVVNGKERSERGLFDMDKNTHAFAHTGRDSYPEDITTEATSKLRSGLVPEGTIPLGYVYYGDQLYRPDGTVIWENLHTSPPDDGTPYAPFYGEKYLTFEETFEGEVNLPVEAYKKLFECLMRIRYNGVSTKSFLTSRASCAKTTYKT
jgi:hypothetical protein